MSTCRRVSEEEEDGENKTPRSSSSSSSSWSQLHPDLLRLIANRLNSYEDFVTFGAVCPSWRSIAIKENFNRSRQIPWLLLRTIGTEDGCPVLFNNPKRKFHKLFLPEANSRYDPCFSFASHGWLLIQTSQIYLLHPLTRKKILLPDLINLKNSTQLVNFTIEFNFKAALSCSPTWTQNFSVMVTYSDGLAFYKAGDSAWTLVTVEGANRIFDVIFYGDQFYFLDNRGRVLVFKIEDVGTNSINDSKVVIFQVPNLIFNHGFFNYKRNCHLVEMESSKTLMIVLQTKNFNHTNKFEVLKLDLENGKCEEVERLDNKALFLGQNSTLSMEIKRRSGIGYKANCIYFTDNNNYDINGPYRVCKEKILGVYNMQTGRTEKWFGDDNANFSPAMWIELLPS